MQVAPSIRKLKAGNGVDLDYTQMLSYFAPSIRKLQAGNDVDLDYTQMLTYFAPSIRKLHPAYASCKQETMLT
jgi:hypothetical protein